MAEYLHSYCLGFIWIILRLLYSCFLRHLKNSHTGRGAGSIQRHPLRAGAKTTGEGGVKASVEIGYKPSLSAGACATVDIGTESRT